MMQSTHTLEELKQVLPQCLLPDQVRIGSLLARWLHAPPSQRQAAAVVERWLARAKASVALRRRREANRPRLHYPPELPITSRRQDIVTAIQTQPVVVIAGETGSGKTTQIPKMCLEAGLGVRAQIGCTQPRRVAALAISRRLAEELDVTLGREVGCKIRFADQTSPETSIKVMTDGILLAETQADPLLSEYEALIIDEAHERSLNIDFLLGYLKLLLGKRPDLKLIITSATIDTEAFSRAFNRAPVIEVSGRLYPVEVVYAPVDVESEEEGEVTYIDAAVNAVQAVAQDTTSGDVLVFMPGERDIRETCDQLEARASGSLDIMPLFARLTSAEQQRIFAPANRRRVVVATNIAETSLTIPRIRYVVDSGLARLSRFNPRTRTKRLPVEPISQSSANQRKGRCGRLADGVCIRLFSEADFQARPAFTQPEIQRANLAEVILRMKAFRLGEIETFPFLNPPSSQSIHGGYQLLQELGALDAQRELTPLGRDLARLPIDPIIGRMILQARTEKAVREVLIIAAGLSIQDPRERPLDQKDAATTAHRRFLHPRSDFLTLLNVWQAYHDTWESLKTQNQLRKFCKAHFLSFVRMREWVDLHTQLQEAVEELGDFGVKEPDADYAAIHRSIVTGLWAQVALRQERNLYRLAGDRQAMVFPGSSLFARTTESKPVRGAKPPPARAPAAVHQPQWLMAGEIVETSRLFLRTVAEVDPQWILELAGHLCRRSHTEPHWDAEAGRVLVRERVLLNGLEVINHLVPYSQVDPTAATEIFIRSALVEEGLRDVFRAPAPIEEQFAARPERERRSQRRIQHELEKLSLDQPAAAPVFPYPFLDHNRQLRHKIEIWQTRLHHRIIPDLDEAIYQFYAQRLSLVSSVPDLNRALKDQARNEPHPLYLTTTALLGERAPDFDTLAFPDQLVVGNGSVELSYAYTPGEETDGVTVKLPVTLAQVIEPGLLDWAVPGLREERVLHLLQALPKTVRRDLMPLPPKAREIAQALATPGRSLLAAMSAFIRRQYGVMIPESSWAVDTLPAHLRPRLEIIGGDRQILATGRDLQALRDQLQHHDTPAETGAWQQAVERWERYGLAAWDFGDPPEQLVVTEVGGFPLYAYPGLQVEDGQVNLRLFRKPEEAQRTRGPGLARLAEKVLQRELGWLHKDLKVLDKLKPFYVTLGPGEELTATAGENLHRYLLNPHSLTALNAAAFEAWVARIRQELPGLASRLAERAGAILQLRQQLLMCPKPYPALRQDVDALVPKQFLRRIPFERLEHLPRYLKALRIRAERAAVSPAKDAEKARRVQPYVAALQGWAARASLPEPAQELLEQFRWLVEEYKVSCFAQELGTAEPVSPKKLDRELEELKRL